MDEDEQLRRAMEESLQTARAEDDRRAQEASRPTAPMLPQDVAVAETASMSESVSEFERQRQEAIRRQAARWHQMHVHAEEQPGSLQQQGSGDNQRQTSLYPSMPADSVPSEAARTPLYPSIPRYTNSSSIPLLRDGMDISAPHSQQQSLQPAAYHTHLDELQRKKRQEEEDHRLALQLAEAYAAEDEFVDPEPHEAYEDSGPPHTSLQYVPDGSDSFDWQEVHRTASMQRASAAGSTDAPGSIPGSTRPSSQAAAAAGSAAGGVLGAGLSALLAMAANAAARSAHHSPGSSTGATATASSTGNQQHQHAAASSERNQQQQQATAGDNSASAATSNSSGVQGMLGMAANALWNYVRGRNSNSSSATATATNPSSEHHQQHQQQHDTEDRDMHMLQQVMRQLMMEGAPGQQQASVRGSSSSGPGQRGGFRVVSLPGGGFAATYSSSSSSSTDRHQQQSSMVDEDPFAGFMGPGEDLMTQLLLAGARSARSNHYRQQQQQDPLSFHPLGPSFTTFDPETGSSRFEPMGGMFMPEPPGFPGGAGDQGMPGFPGFPGGARDQGMPEFPGFPGGVGDQGMPGFPGFPGGAGDQGLEALFQALMGGHQGLGGDRNLRYEDVADLANVHVTTPENVLAQLPRSKYVEGRKPGESDTCVICQTECAAGDSLLHLPCLHAFHEDCITPWLQGHSKKCPVCKTDVY